MVEGGGNLLTDGVIVCMIIGPGQKALKNDHFADRLLRAHHSRGDFIDKLTVNPTAEQ